MSKRPVSWLSGRWAERSADLIGIAAASFLAITVNVLAARHVRRSDWTEDKRYSLSPATVDTLSHLRETVTIWVLLGPGDPLEQSVKQLLASYEAESHHVVLHSIDPDHDAAALVDLRRRFDVEAGRSEDGRVVTDAVIIVERADRHWFLTPADLFEQTDDSNALPREERAITGAIRSVLANTRSRLCFTVGHGELSLEPSREGSIGELRSILEKDNYEVAAIDTTRPDPTPPFTDCTAVVVAGLKSPFSKSEATLLRGYLQGGGGVLAALGPVVDSAGISNVETGLDDVFAPFGVKLGPGLVHDPDPHVAIAGTRSEAFVSTALPHAITAGLVAEPGSHPPSVVTFFSRPIEHAVGGDSATASELLRSTPSAYAVRDLRDATSWDDTPPKSASDPSGPFVLAMASERPKLALGMPHGPRLVVFGTTYALADDNWRQPRPVRGGAFLVENALSWLSSRSLVLDVPQRHAHAAAVRMTEESIVRVRSYVLLYMPAAALLLSILVALYRKSGEGAPYRSGAERRSRP